MSKNRTCQRIEQLTAQRTVDQEHSASPRSIGLFIFVIQNLVAGSAIRQWKGDATDRSWLSLNEEVLLRPSRRSNISCEIPFEMG